MAITPRHFLDFIQHYIKLFHEKRRDLEEEKLHLNIGLNKVTIFLFWTLFFVNLHVYSLSRSKRQKNKFWNCGSL